MKLAILLSSLLISLSSLAQVPYFSAFGQNEQLYVTILGDSCNSLRPGLIVAEMCKADRKFRNLARHCGAELVVSSTKMFCGDSQPVPRVMTIDLQQANMAPEVQMLFLTYGNQKIQVRLK